MMALRKFILIILVALAASLIGNHSASAASTSNLIDDGVFDNTSTMNAGQIDSWLNSFSNSCISTNSGFSASDPAGYSPNYPHADGRYIYGPPVSAGQVIYDAAKAHGLNPQVLVTKLQNEEQLVDGSAGCGSTWRYASAVGYACTDSDTFSHSYSYTGADPFADSSALPTPIYYRNGNPVNSISGSCVNTNVYAGFSEQVVHAAWALSIWRHKSEGQTSWAAINGSWNHCDDNNSCPVSFNIPPRWACYGGLMTQGNFKRCPTDTSTVSYDGYATIDGQSTHMDNGATAALYVYTPHIQSFTSIFTNFFSPPYDQYRVSFYSFSGYPSIYVGSSSNSWIEYQNTGDTNLYDQTSYPVGTNPLVLAMSNPINRSSIFYDGSSWTNNSRPTAGFAAVYESDGTTLAANQHWATPGQIIKFAFDFKVPDNTSAQTYQEYLQPVMEGASNWNVGGYGYFNVIVLSTYKASFYNMQGYPSLYQGTQTTKWIEYKNNGNASWYDQTSAPAGISPLVLAMTNPINRVSSFYDSATWTNNNRPTKGFTAVYEADGTTPAADQHQAQPGQIVKFNVTFTAKTNQSTGSYREWIQPVLEGSNNWNVGASGYFNVTIQGDTRNASFVAFSGYPAVIKGNIGPVWIEYKNNGNASWYDQTSAPAGISPLVLAMTNPINRVSSFYDSATWTNNNRPTKGFTAVYEADGTTPAADQHQAQPGQIVKFAFDFKAPSTMASGTYREWLQPVLEGASSWNIGASGYFDVTVP